MSYTQDFFTSRNVVVGDEQKIGQEGRLWYDPVTNSIRVSDGVTPGGIFVGTGAPYQLPTATNTVLGGVKVDGTTIVINPTTGEISSTTGDAYILQKASNTTLGGIRVGNNLSIDENGVLSATAYALPTASDTVVGGVRVDNSTITINDGVISARQYSLPTASDDVIGGVKIGSGLFLDAQSRLNAQVYTLPIASDTALGGVRVDNSSIKIDGNGLISYDLPIASASKLGGIKVGNGLTIDENGVLNTANDWVMSLTAGQGISLSSNTGNITVSTRLATTGTVGSVRVDNSTIVVDTTGRISVTTSGVVGTVKSVAVNSARGFFGDVELSTTYPTITLGTSVNGIIKGFNDSLISAEPNVDYQLPVSLTTNGLTGSATFTNNVLNIPNYQGQITLQTVGTSGAATFSENVLNIPDYGSVLSVELQSDDLSITGTNPITRSGSWYLALNTVPISKGGTGQTRFDAGYLISDGNALSTTVTISGSTITGDISGKSSGLTQILSPEFGGTGTNNLNTLFTSILPDQTGNANKILSTDGGGILSWVDQAAAAVTSVDVVGGTTGLTTSGGPINSVNKAGVITLGGTLNVASGGTGATSPDAARDKLSAAKSGANSDITSLSGLTTPLSVEQGGTGSTSASDARIALDVAKRGVNSDITRLTGLTTPLSVAQGGTGSTTASGARINLSAAKSGANSDITSLSGLEIPLSVNQGGTGSNTPIGARNNLEAAKRGDNTDITSLSGLTTPLSVSQGGTGGKTPEEARNNLEAAKRGDNSDITSLSGLTTPLSVPQGGTGLSTMIGPNRTLYSTSSTSLIAGILPIAAGGTGAETASDARFNLSAAKSGANSDITSLSGLTTPLSIEQGGTGTSTASEALNAILPSQAGKKDFVLTTNGTTVRWDIARPGAVGSNGQLQFNNEGFLGGTSRILYDGRGELTVGTGSTEQFLIVGQEAKNITNGGTSVEIKGGDSYAIEGITIPPAGNLYLTGGRGIGLADSGFISFSTGTQSDEVFRINSSGAWSFDNIETNTGEQNNLLISRGPNQSPNWDPMIASYSKRGIVLIYPPEANGVYGGLELVTHPVAGAGISLKAKVAEIDNITLRNIDGSGKIKVNTINVGNEIIPNQTGKQFHFLTTDGISLSTQEGTTSGSLIWSKLPLATYGPTSEPGVIKINENHLQLDQLGQLGLNNLYLASWFYNDFFPTITGNSNKVLSNDGEKLLWKAIEEPPLRMAGIGPDGILGGVKLDGDTIVIDESGVIEVNVDGLFPVANTEPVERLYLSYYYEDGIQLEWQPVIASDLQIATTDKVGVVKPDGKTIKITTDGTLRADINELLPKVPDNSVYRYLRTDGQELTWVNTVVPVANYITPGIVALDPATIYINPNTDQITATAIKLIDADQYDQGKLLYASFHDQKTLFANALRYFESGIGSYEDDYQPHYSLSFGDPENDESTNFALAANPQTNIRISTSSRGEAFPGNIEIIGGNHSSKNTSGGKIYIKAGDGFTSFSSGRNDGADVIIEAGSGMMSANPDVTEGGYYPDMYGGEIILKTTRVEESLPRLTITNTGAWKLGALTDPEDSMGSPGQPLLSGGEDTTPYWGIVNIEWGGTGATNKVDALNNLLPDQELAENFVLASNGTSAYWTSLSGNSLIPSATEGRLGVVRPDGITTITDINGVISVITGGVVGTVNSVEMSGGTTGLTTNGGPITNRGTFTLGGTLKIEHGGTGSTTVEAAIKKLLPIQNSSTAGKSLVSDGSTASWTYPTTVLSPGVNKNLLFNKSGIIDGIPDINYVDVSALRLGRAWSDENDNNFFTIFGASNNEWTSTSSTSINAPVAVSLVLQSGTSDLPNRFGADIFLKGGSASGNESTGGNVYIDGGTSVLGPGGNIVFRTAKDPSSPLIERISIDNSGKIKINEDYGSVGMVLTSGGEDQLPSWKFPSVNAGGLTGTTLPTAVVNSSLKRLGKLESLYINELRYNNIYGTGGLRIGGTDNSVGNFGAPRTDLEVIRTKIVTDDYGIMTRVESSFQVLPDDDKITLSCLQYPKTVLTENSPFGTQLDTDAIPLLIECDSIDIKTKDLTEDLSYQGGWFKPRLISQLKIHATGQWDIQGQSGTAGQILTSTGSNSAPVWKTITKVPLYEEQTATAEQTVVNCSIPVKANTFDTILNSKISYIQVFINGVLQREGTTKSYMVTGSNQITFNQALQADDDITIYSFV